jgi:hypothetical protein
VYAGLIHNAETNLIATVRQLVEHYIEDQDSPSGKKRSKKKNKKKGKTHTLIVIAMPMTGECDGITLMTLFLTFRYR